MSKSFKEFALANIKKVVITTDDGKSYEMEDVYSKAECTAYVNEGEEMALRIKNTIKAQNNFEDIVLGYDITLGAATVVPEVLVLVDGGEWDAEKSEYKAPSIGQAVNRKSFKVEVWTEDKDCDGDVKQYMVFTFLNCKGTPLSYDFEDGEFFVPEMVLKSRPKCGESPVSFRIEPAEVGP